MGEISRPAGMFISVTAHCAPLQTKVTSVAAEIRDFILSALLTQSFKHKDTKQDKVSSFSVLCL